MEVASQGEPMELVERPKKQEAMGSTPSPQTVASHLGQSVLPGSLLMYPLRWLLVSLFGRRDFRQPLSENRWV